MNELSFLIRSTIHLHPLLCINRYPAWIVFIPNQNIHHMKWKCTSVIHTSVKVDYFQLFLYATRSADASSFLNFVEVWSFMNSIKPFLQASAKVQSNHT